MALTGESFCQSARDGFYMMMRNISRFAITEGVGSMVSFLGVLFITAASTTVGYLWVT